MDKKTTSKSSKRVASKATSKKTVPSQEQIAVRAYFISQRRQQMGWNGDHISDWVEAESQLLAEANKNI